MNGAAASGPVDELDRVEEILRRACGLSLSRGLRRTLADGYQKAASALNLRPAELLARMTAGDPDSISALVENTVIGETYFFRHPEQFAALRKQLTCFASEPVFSAWSAGCATGEEAYTVSMLLSELGRGEGRARVLATDVSERALRRAREARYGSWSMRKLDATLQKRFFTPAEGNELFVAPAVRKIVEFKRHNLIADPAPISDCHLVFCRNVLIYFSPETAAHVLRKLASALLPGGFLVLGPVELPQAATLGMEWIDCEGATLLRKPDPSRAPIVKPAPVQTRRAPAAAPLAKAPHAERARPPKPAAAPAQPPAPVAPEVPPGFAKAREAARAGKLDDAEKLARESAKAELAPEAYLLLSLTADARGDLKAAVDAVKRALYLDNSLATAHAALVTLFQRMGQPADAERARRNALEVMRGLDDAAVLKGVEIMTAGALRRALQQDGSDRAP